MAHLWIEEYPGDWAVILLESSRVDLTTLRKSARGATRERTRARTRAAYLLRDAARERAAWHLLARPEIAISINGLPLLGGLRVLDDRDEIRLAGDDALFFSTEELARVVPTPITDKPMMCPRCRQRVEPGTLAVCCPDCRLWYHQSDALPCWTYAPTCALCPQPTPLDTGFRWTPMEL